MTGRFGGNQSSLGLVVPASLSTGGELGQEVYGRRAVGSDLSP